MTSYAQRSNSAYELIKTVSLTMISETLNMCQKFIMQILICVTLNYNALISIVLHSYLDQTIKMKGLTIAEYNKEVMYTRLLCFWSRCCCLARF